MDSPSVPTSSQAVLPRVLVVDDEAWMRDACVQVLQDEGLEVLAACDGQSALEMVRQYPPDLVLIDLKMPGMDGMAVLKSIKAMDPDVGAVVITGFATMEAAVEAMRTGAYDFLAKPFNPGELRTVVRRGLEHRQAALRTTALIQEKAPPAEFHLAVLAHRFKEPLAVLRTCVSVIQQGHTGELPPRARDMLDVVAARADQMIHFVDDWLTLARLERCRGIREPKPVDLMELVRSVAQRVRPRAEANSLTLLVAVKNEPPVIQGDGDALDELLGNLLDNAVRYTPAGGTVSLEIDGREGWASLAVRDTGPSVPEEERDRIFEPFFRGKKQKAIAGTGLGLPIARRIALAHGGKIELETAAGQGALFRVLLPCQEQRINELTNQRSNEVTK